MAGIKPSLLISASKSLTRSRGLWPLFFFALIAQMAESPLVSEGGVVRFNLRAPHYIGIIVKSDKRLLVPRNHVAVLAKFRKAGSHRKTNKQLRAKERREMENGSFA